MAVLRHKFESIRAVFVGSNTIKTPDHATISNNAGRAHAAADAHRHDDVLRAAPLAFDQRMAGEALRRVTP